MHAILSCAPKTALITGASSGIGLELAHLFARDGYRLVLVARIVARCASLATICSRASGVTVRISHQRSRPPRQSRRSSYHELQESGVVLDVLVNNAGFGAAWAHFSKPNGPTSRR